MISLFLEDGALVFLIYVNEHMVRRPSSERIESYEYRRPVKVNLLLSTW